VCYNVSGQVDEKNIKSGNAANHKMCLTDLHWWNTVHAGHEPVAGFIVGVS
jgi:hypothetical protein